MRAITLLSCAPFIVGSLALASTAGAQPRMQRATTTTMTDYIERTVDGDQVVQFGGDELVGLSGAPIGGTIMRPPGVTRVGLIRPRMNFVTELLKAVENL